MTNLQLRHVDCFTDRHGHRRYYFRRGHGPRMALPGLPGEANFKAAYLSALRSDKIVKKLATNKMRGSPGTFDRWVTEYFVSPKFRRLGATTQINYRRVIERFVLDEKIGHRLVAEMRREHVNRMIAKRADTHGAANDFLKKIRVLIHFAIDNGWRTDNPTLRMKRYAAGEWHTWTDDEITMFEARWLKGTCERTALALFCAPASAAPTWSGWPGMMSPMGPSGSSKARPAPSCRCRCIPTCRTPCPPGRAAESTFS